MTVTGQHATTATWEAPDGGEWALDASHGITVRPIAMRRQMEEAFAEGFRTSMNQLGMPLSHIELRHVNDYAYSSVFVHEAPRSAGKPPPDFVLKLLTRLHPKSRARTKVAARAIADRTAQGYATTWDAERDSWHQRVLTHQRVDVAALDRDALAAHVERGVSMGLASMRRHFELVLGAIPFGEWLVAAERWRLPAEAARDAVMFGTLIHEQAAERRRRIRTAIGDAMPASLEEVRAISPEAEAALDDYLDHHGCWITEDDVSGPLLQDFPDVILRSIMATPTVIPTAPSLSDRLAPLRQQVPAAERAQFDRLAADAHAAYRMLDDDSAILCSWSWGVVSRDLRTAARVLAHHGDLLHVEHVWALTTDEVVAMLGGSGPSPTEAADRHAGWQRNAALDPPLHLNGEPSPPPDPSVFPAPVARLVAGMGAFLADKFNDAGTAQGIGDSSVSGRAIVVESASDALDRIEPGDILVTTATNPAYNAVLPIVGGLVTSTGGPSCHAAVVARELGIPAIVAYPNATERIDDGSSITLDPSRATVTAG